MRRARPRIRGWPRAWLAVPPLLFAGATVALSTRYGLFFMDRDWRWPWLLCGLLAFTVTDVRRWTRGVVFDWLPFIAAIMAYDVLRGAAGEAAADAHTQLDAERWLFGGTLPTVWLQHHLWDAAHPHLYDDVVWAIYNTHFVGVLIVAAVLWRVSRERFLRFRAVIVALTLAACATFRARPTVPPWLAVPHAGAGRVDRIADLMWRHVSVQRGSPLFEHGTRWANQYAAWPSLHAAFPCVLLLFFWASAPLALRVLLVGYALAMGFTLVYAGEHYVVDILGGWAYAGAAFALVEAAYRVAPARARAVLG